MMQNWTISESDACSNKYMEGFAVVESIDGLTQKYWEGLIF